MLCMLLFRHPVMSNSLWLHGLQHTRPPCPSSPPGVHPSLCPFNWWCHPTISSFVTPFSCPQLFQASWSFPMSWLFESGGQSIGASASASVLPMSIQGNVVSLLYYIQFSSAQSLSRVQLFETPWTAAHQTSLSITNDRSLLKLTSIESVMPSNHLILCHPFLLPPSIFPSIRVFSNESVLCIRWPKYWSFSFSISPSNEYSGLISFRMDWLDLLAVQGSLKSLLQHHSSKASILQDSAFFIVQLWHPYMTTGKTKDLTRRTFVGKIMLFNMLSRLVITFLPSSKCLLISWLQSLSAVILEPPEIKSLTVSIVSPSICHEVMGPNAMILVFWMLSLKPTFSLSLSLSSRGSLVLLFLP